MVTVSVESGLGWTSFSIDDASGTLRDLKSVTTSLSFATPRAVQDISALGDSAMRRLLLMADMTVEAALLFDDAANSSHDVLKTVPSTSVAREILLNVSGQILGTTPQVTLLITDYALERADSGELTITAPMSLANAAIPTWTT